MASHLPRAFQRLPVDFPQRFFGANAALAFLVAIGAPVIAIPPAGCRYQQRIEVPAPGLMRMDLPPATLNAARPELQDLRLLDAAGIEVPFLIEEPTPVPGSRQRPKSFTTSLATTSTALLIETGVSKPVSGITLESPGQNFVLARLLPKAGPPPSSPGPT